jgi:hypothetical protein
MYKVRPPLMQIEDFLPAAGVMGLTAQPGVGKTWLAMEVARAVGSGSPLLGKLKSHRGGVLFVGADSSIYDYARQWKRLTMMTPDADEVFEPVRFLLQESFLFEDRDEVRRLIQTHRRFEWGETVDGKRQRGFHVIVFDTLSALTNVPENDNTGREQVFRMVRLIAEVTDCAIIVVHHNAAKSEFNDGENFRGGTSQLGRLDSHLNLKPSRKDPYLVEVNYKKFRGIRPKNFAYKMDVNDPLTASLLATTEPVTLEDRLNFDPLGEAIMANVRQHPGIRAVEIGAEAIFKATRVDGIYTADPEKDPTATKLDRVGYIEVLNRGLKVMDTTAISLCMENKLPIVIFDLNQPGNIRKIVSGEPVGSMVSADVAG